MCPVERFVTVDATARAHAAGGRVALTQGKRATRCRLLGLGGSELRLEYDTR